MVKMGLMPFSKSRNPFCEWNVDTANNDKILTVKSEGITEDEIVAIVKKKGFKAEPLMV